MHKLTPILALACLAFLAPPALAKEGDLNFGAGLGFTYSGLGGYAAYTTGTRVFGVSAGAAYIGSDDTDTSFRLSLGYQF